MVAPVAYPPSSRFWGMTQTGAHVLLAGGDPDPGEVDRESLARALTEYPVATEPDFQTALDRVTDGDCTCVVTHHDPDGFDGLAFLEAVRRAAPGFPVVLIPVENDPELARRAVEAGVTAYVPRTHPDAFDAVVDAVHATCAETPPTPIPDRLAARGLSLSAELMVVKQTLDAAPIGITITSAEGPDNPIVYANSQYEAMTGYDREELLGVNSRFLQGQQTDPERVAELRSAIEAEEPVTVVLRNYRKDGSEFWNRIHVTPIRNGEGMVTHYAGFQQEVADGTLADGTAELRLGSNGETDGTGP